MMNESNMAKGELSPAHDSVGWSVETMQLINRLTPDINGKAFDPDWFLLRQRLEAMETCNSQMLAVLRAIVGHIDSGGTISDSRLDALRFIEPAKRAILCPPNTDYPPPRSHNS